MIASLRARLKGDSTSRVGLACDPEELRDVIQAVAREYDDFVESTVSSGDGTTPFYYVEKSNHYRSLIARLDALITRACCDRFNASLAKWSQNWGYTHASSPHVRLYPDHCERLLSRDAHSGAKAHYIIGLSGATLGKLKLDVASAQNGRAMSLRNFAVFRGVVLVHSADDHYSIKSSKIARGLHDYAALLDGYLW